MIAFFGLTPESSLFWEWAIVSVAAVFAALAVSAISVVFHQVVTEGIGPIRWLRPFFFVRTRFGLWRDRRREAAKLPPAVTTTTDPTTSERPCGWKAGAAVTHPVDAISGADLADRRDIGPPVALRHFIRFDEPSARSRRSQRAVCGLHIFPRDVAYQRDDVTCPTCAQWMDDYETLEIA